jgi:hypothetical protein
MRESPVGLSHTVCFLAFTDGGALPIGSFHQFRRKFF